VPGCDPQLQELVLAELDDYSPTAIQESDEDDPDQRLRAFFTTAEARDQAARALGAAFGKHLFVELTDVDDEDWAERSQAELRAVTVGRITVAPPWEKMGSDPIFVVIQPSMGFGTGHHATTRLMLGAIQALDLHDRYVLDIGCGSGVLAIAAVLLGARGAVGVDNDPDALASAAENVARNPAAGARVRLLNADLQQLAQVADIVLANLTGSLLERSADHLAGLVGPGGHLVVSGFMESEPDVLPSLENWLTLVSVEQEEEWRCAVLTRGPSTRSAAPQ
jgi:ribosomal protein L11 methyltransferase